MDVDGYNHQPTAGHQLALDAGTKMQSIIARQCRFMGQDLPEYQFTEFLGQSLMGSTWKAVSRETSRVFAVKKVNFGPQDPAWEAGLYSDIQTDIENIQKLGELDRDGRVSALYETFLMPNALCFVSEYCSGMSIAVLMKPRGCIEFPMYIPILRETAAALQWVHEQGMRHRNLKCSNILLTEHGHVKLGDFGVFGVIESRVYRSTFVSSLHWTPPERFSHLPTRDRPYGDVWAFGAVAYELATGAPPNVACIDHTQLASHLENHQPHLDPSQHLPELVDLITKCTAKNVADRLSFDQIVLHPFLLESAQHWPTSLLITLIEEYKDWERHQESSAVIYTPLGLQGMRYAVYLHHMEVLHPLSDQLVLDAEAALQIARASPPAEEARDPTITGYFDNDGNHYGVHRFQAPPGHAVFEPAPPVVLPQTSNGATGALGVGNIHATQADRYQPFHDPGTSSQRPSPARGFVDDTHASDDNSHLPPTGPEQSSSAVHEPAEFGTGQYVAMNHGSARLARPVDYQPLAQTSSPLESPTGPDGHLHYPLERLSLQNDYQPLAESISPTQSLFNPDPHLGDTVGSWPNQSGFQPLARGVSSEGSLIDLDAAYDQHSPGSGCENGHQGFVEAGSPTGSVVYLNNPRLLGSNGPEAPLQYGFQVTNGGSSPTESLIDLDAATIQPAAGYHASTALHPHLAHAPGNPGPMMNGEISAVTSSGPNVASYYSGLPYDHQMPELDGAVATSAGLSPSFDAISGPYMVPPPATSASTSNERPYMTVDPGIDPPSPMAQDMATETESPRSYNYTFSTPDHVPDLADPVWQQTSWDDQ